MYVNERIQAQLTYVKCKWGRRVRIEVVVLKNLMLTEPYSSLDFFFKHSSLCFKLKFAKRSEKSKKSPFTPNKIIFIMQDITIEICIWPSFFEHTIFQITNISMFYSIYIL